MIKPSPGEVTAYAKSIGYVLDGEHFCDFYEMRGWITGKAQIPMRSWQAAVRTWKNNRGGFGIGKAQSQVGKTGGFVPSREPIA